MSINWKDSPMDNLTNEQLAYITFLEEEVERLKEENENLSHALDCSQGEVFDLLDMLNNGN